MFATRTVKITGSWCLSDAPARMEELRGELERLQQEGAPVRIDLAGTTEVDACGCQMLLLFRENLRRHGIEAACTGAAPEPASTISLLGYHALLEDVVAEGEVA